jgi:hypothetical protein
MSTAPSARPLFRYTPGRGLNAAIQCDSVGFASITANSTQVVTAADTPTLVKWDTNEVNTGAVAITGVNNTQIVFRTTGVFKVGISPQIDMGVNQTKEFLIWFRKNGVDIPRSASMITLRDSNAEGFFYVELLIPMSKDDYLEFVFASNEATMELLAVPAQTSPYPRPAVPSAILTIEQLAYNLVT